MKLKQIQSLLFSTFIFTLALVFTFCEYRFSQKTNQWSVRPMMTVKNSTAGKLSPMRLDKLKIDIKVVGQIAVTTLDMTFFNDNSRLLEGELNFPLADGQTISRFALDINGVLREGVVVDKEQGRKTFEAIVRRGVDPGLLEKTVGNNFRVRVYPLPAKGSRRVVLAFEQELTDKGTFDLYLLPLKIDEAISKFSIHTEIVKNSVKLDSENNEFENLSFQKWNDSYVANMEMDNYVPNKKIALSFPHTMNSEKVFTAAMSNHPDSSYFYINIKPEVIAQDKVLPKRITVVWDNSNSAHDRNIDKDLALLGNYIQKIGNLTVDLVRFNIKTAPIQSFVINNGNWEQLKNALNSTVYDGGTSLGCLDFSKFSGDEVLLFSDGITNFGLSEPKKSAIPVYTFNSSFTANHSLLTFIAQQSGGVFFDLTKLTTDEVVNQITKRNYHFISSTIENGKISGQYPTLPCQFNKSFGLVGKMSGKSAKLVLNFGYGSTISYSKKIEINTDNSADSSILRRLWAEKKIAELSLNEVKNRAEITLTAKRYGIVTSNTSLLVLENLNDYLANDIVPPLELQAAYFQRKNEIIKEASDKLNQKIETIVQLSNEQSKWWNTNYPIVMKTKSHKFTASGIRRDEEVSERDELKSQDQLNSNNVTISIADVKGNNESGMDIADVKEIRVGYGSRKNEDRKNENQATIELNAWDPQTPYLKVLQYAATGAEYATYLKLKKEYGLSPSFYIDAADFFAKANKKDTALLILSNLAELSLESPQLLRILANKLQDYKYNSEALVLFEKLLALKGEEPQSYRDLGLSYAANGKYQEAINSLYKVLIKDWDGRFSEIELIALNEINSIISNHPGLKYTFIDKRLIKNEPVNIRVVLTWDTDNCDMDLWVTDPSGEKCSYENRLTRIGGKISKDITGGYGPEEFMIKHAINGNYQVHANYYGTRSQSQLSPVNLHLVFYVNFGKPNQKKEEVTIRLENSKDIISIGKFSFLNK